MRVRWDTASWDDSATYSRETLERPIEQYQEGAMSCAVCQFRKIPGPIIKGAGGLSTPKFTVKS